METKTTKIETVTGARLLEAVLTQAKWLEFTKGREFYTADIEYIGPSDGAPAGAWVTVVWPTPKEVLGNDNLDPKAEAYFTQYEDDRRDDSQGLIQFYDGEGGYGDSANPSTFRALYFNENGNLKAGARHGE